MTATEWLAAAAAAAALLLLGGCQQQVIGSGDRDDPPAAQDPPNNPEPDPEPESEPEPEAPQRIDAYALDCLSITEGKSRYGESYYHTWDNVCSKDIVVLFCQDSFEQQGGGVPGNGIWRTAADCGSPFADSSGNVGSFYTPEQAFYNRGKHLFRASDVATADTWHVTVSTSYEGKDGTVSWRVTYRYAVCYADLNSLPSYLRGYPYPTIVSDSDGNYACWIES